MTQEAIKNPKVFISYSWSSTEYQQWVVEIARRLMSDGIEVIIDVWNLVEGQDKYVFMEQMVKSDEINKVLIFCDKKYKEKADLREGGVGDETQIISSKVYKDVTQEKFIPIIAERDVSGDSFVPTYMESRIYIDLSDNDAFEDNYDKLIRNIHQVPLFQKPKIGGIPSHLVEREINHFQTAIIIKRMVNLIDKQPNRLKSLANEFTEKFMEELKQLVVENVDGENRSELMYKKIEETVPLKNEYLSMLKLLCDADVIEVEYLIEFFEEFYFYTDYRDNGYYFETQSDHFKFLFMEMYLHTVRVLLQYKKYDILADMVNSKFHVKSNRDREPQSFYSFYFHIETLEQRNINLDLRRISLQADLLYQRAEKYGQELAEADYLLYFISEIQNNDMFGWYPILYIYLNNYPRMKVIRNLESNRHFENVKVVFNVNNKAEFISRIQEMVRKRGLGVTRSVPLVSDIINPILIGTKN